MQDQEEHRVADETTKFWDRDSIEIKMIKPWRWYNWIFPFRREIILSNIRALEMDAKDDIAEMRLNVGKVTRRWKFGR